MSCETLCNLKENTEYSFSKLINDSKESKWKKDGLGWRRLTFTCSSLCSSHIVIRGKLYLVSFRLQQYYG